MARMPTVFRPFSIVSSQFSVVSFQLSVAGSSPPSAGCRHTFDLRVATTTRRVIAFCLLPFAFCLLPLLSQLRHQVDLRPRQGLRYRTTLLRSLGELLEFPVVDSRHFALRVEVNLCNRKAVANFLKSHPGLCVHAFGREPVLLERCGKRHRETTRVRRADELFGIGSRAALHARLERKRAVIGARSHLHVALTSHQIPFP